MNNYSSLLNTDSLSKLLIEQGVNPHIVEYLRLFILMTLLSILLWIIDFIAKRFVIGSVQKIFTLTKNKWDDVLIEKKVFNRLSHLLPAFIVHWSAPFLLRDFDFITPAFHKGVEIYVNIIILAVFISFFNALEFYFSNSKKFKDKPIESYFQLAKLTSYFIGGIFILSILLGKSPIYLLSAVGAVSAVLLLIFKDTILGFVASIQIAANDMLRVDDWVEMEKYGADGDVLKITLNTVKVRNWDKTITTIPTYAFVSDSFKNWRGMQETGARRIKRHIYIRPSSIKFLNKDSIIEIEKIQLIKDYLISRQTEIDDFNTKTGADKVFDLNGRNQTNIGVFRKYLENYLEQHTKIRRDLTLMVRQLQSNQYGVPMEIYCFSNTTVWTEYEAIQGDIFDHVIAASKYFKLEVYELNGITPN